MIDTIMLKSRLHQRIALAERTKTKDQPVPVAGCSHEWSTYRQAVVPNSEQFKGTGAHFIVKGCARCRGKRTVGYVVER